MRQCAIFGFYSGVFYITSQTLFRIKIAPFTLPVTGGADAPLLLNRTLLQIQRMNVDSKLVPYRFGSGDPTVCVDGALVSCFCPGLHEVPNSCRLISVSFLSQYGETTV